MPRKSRSYFDRLLRSIPRLETVLEGGVLLDVLAVVVERRRTDDQARRGPATAQDVAGVNVSAAPVPTSTCISSMKKMQLPAPFSSSIMTFL